MKFLVDANLPDDFSSLGEDSFIFVKNISLTLADTAIWDMALTHHYTILTRDKDFYYRSLQRKKTNTPNSIVPARKCKKQRAFQLFSTTSQ